MSCSEGCEVYKIMRNIDGVDSQTLFPWARVSKTRGLTFKVRVNNFNDDEGQVFHTLDGGYMELVARGGRNIQFKSHLNRHLDSKQERYKHNEGQI